MNQHPVAHPGDRSRDHDRVIAGAQPDMTDSHLIEQGIERQALTDLKLGQPRHTGNMHRIIVAALMSKGQPNGRRHEYPGGRRRLCGPTLAGTGSGQNEAAQTSEGQ